ncbi:MAG: hypothetical protein ACR2JQ_08190 [Mycobacteriales bacterium]
MAVLWWLVPALLVAVGGAVATAWLSRPRGPAGMGESIDAHRRFVATLGHDGDPGSNVRLQAAPGGAAPSDRREVRPPADRPPTPPAAWPG